MNNILILPRNEQELFHNYFDAAKFADLKARYDLLRKALRNNLTPQERSLYKLNNDVSEQVKECHQLKLKLFQAAMFSFAFKICQRQREICEEQYRNAPHGKEAEHIIDARIPDLWYDPVCFVKMEEWWASLNDQQLKKIADDFQSDFDQDDRGQNECDIIKNIEKHWQNLPLESRERIYDHYNPKTTPR